MKNRLNYGKLIKGWMQFYHLPDDVAKRLLDSILARIRKLKQNDKNKGETDGNKLECTGGEDKK